MLSLIKRKIEKYRQKRTFTEYDHEIKKFEIDNVGSVEYAQWLHPFDKPKEIKKENIEFYKSLVDPGAMIIDIGAHAGDTTVPMALATGRGGIVVALEPNPFVFKVLAANSRLNRDLTHIEPFCFAATDKEGTFTFNYSDASYCNGGFLNEIQHERHGHNYTLDVKGKNLQAFLKKHYADRLDDLQLIKVDAEGYDKEILKTIQEIVTRYRPNLMVECYKRLNQEERQELWDLLNGFGYDVFYIENFEPDGKRVKLDRDDMMIERHFEMLALPKVDTLHEK